MLFPIFTLFQGMRLLSWINKALLIAVIFLQVSLQFHNFRIKKKWFLLLATVGFVHVYALTQTNFPLYNSNMLFYFAFWILLALYFIDYPEKLQVAIVGNTYYIRKIVQLWTLIVGGSIFLPSSYVINRAWGGGRYFVSITGDPFRLAPTALMIATLVLVLYCITKNKKSLLYLVVPMYSFLMCGSRTYLMVGLLVILSFWYIYCDKKMYFYLTLIPIGLLLGYLILNSAAGAKIAATSTGPSGIFDKWGKLTNGRTVFWEIDIRYFLQENILNQIFGCGFNFDYEVTAKYYTSAHWAHNDFISVLLNFGYVGLCIYIYSFVVIIRRFISRIGMPIVVYVTVVIVWLFNAVFNMFYTYTCSMICYPIMLVALRYFYLEKAGKKYEYK